jgi:two-component system CheB/CheR fusion protein
MADRSARDTATAGVPVAVIGASAGGLEPLRHLLSALPESTGVAFLVVQHRAAGHERLLADLLARAGSPPVSEGVDGMDLLPDRVVIAPAGMLVGIEGRRLRFSPSPDGAVHSIDHAFRAVAEAVGDRAIAVVLSGAGSDGALGVRAVKEAGGLVLVQDPATASSRSMPDAAAASGAADRVLAPGEIAAEIAEFAAHPYMAGDAAAPAGDRLLGEVVGLLQTRTRISFRDYRRRTLARRVDRRMGIRHVVDRDAYLDLLRRDPDEADALATDLMLSVTRFFRDPEAFAELRALVLEPLAAQVRGREVRVWVPGCATGEEAYSLAMLLSEAGAESGAGQGFRIFATDIDVRALETARAGRYPSAIAADVSPERLSRFFEPTDDGHAVRKEIRDAVVFARQDVLADPPFSKMDLISCRNVLIYAEPEAQRRLIHTFHFSLEPGGFLFLGNAETTSGGQDLFDAVSARHRIFQRSGPARHRSVPAPGSGYAGSQDPRGAPPAARTPAEILRRALVSEFAPPSVLVDGRGRVLYFHGRTGDVLDIPAGEPRPDLLAMAGGDLRIHLREALRRAAADGGKAVETAVAAGRAGVHRPVRIVVVPAAGGGPSGEPLFAVSFEVEPEAPPAPPAAPEQEPLVARLERELRLVREDLDGTGQELAAANEALLAAREEFTSLNEELQSANEELETSKEELQSLNEELTTVNTQLQEKVEELEATRDDLSNLLNSTRIATLFLDQDCRIRRFTPEATRLFALIPGDVGRPVTDVTRRFEDPALVDDVGRVLSTLVPAEAQVRAEDGSHLLRRALPYRTDHNRIDGVVITFSDITATVRGSEAAPARARRDAILADLSRLALAAVGDDELLSDTLSKVAATLDADCATVFVPEDGGMLRAVAAEGRMAAQVERGPVPDDPLSDLGQAGARRRAVHVADYAADPSTRPHPAVAGLRPASGIVVPFGGPPSSLLAVHDRRPDRLGDADMPFLQAVTNVLGLALERRRSERTLALAHDLAQDVVDTQRHPMLLLDADGRVVSASAAYRRTFGGTAPEPTGRRFAELDGGAWSALAPVAASVAGGGGSVFGVPVRRREGGAARDFLADVQRLERTPGVVMVSFEDVTERNRAEADLIDARRAAESASASKSRFLASASHDLRQPLQGAVLFHGLAASSNADPKVADWLDHLDRTLGAMGQLLDGLLDISRLDAGIVQPRVAVVDLDAALDRLAVEFAPQAAVVGLRLTAVRSGLAGRTDPLLLDRILRNLIANAIRYTPRGGILVGCRRRGPDVAVQVWDTGSGIPPDQLAAIFEEFHQVANAARDRAKGLGLGLAIVRRLCSLLGHRVRVFSRPGRGSLFEVVLPRAEGAPRSPSAAAPTRDGPRDVVVLVEDDPLVRMSVGALLERAGFAVAAAADAAGIEAAVAAVDPARVACVLSDYRLPGDADGIEAIRRVRRLVGWEAPGVLLTGDTSPDRLREADASGFALVHKPATAEDLLGAVRRAAAADGAAAPADDPA